MKTTKSLPNGVMFNAYPDSIGIRLSDIMNMLGREEFKDTFSLFYVLPTFLPVIAADAGELRIVKPSVRIFHRGKRLLPIRQP